MNNSAGSRRAKVTNITLLYLPLLMLYAFVDASSVKDGGNQVIAYGSILLILLYISVLNNIFLYDKREFLVVAFAGLFVVLGLIPLAWSPAVLFHHIVGDISTFAMVILSFVVLYHDKIQSLSTKVMAIIGIILLLAATYASINPDPINGRYEAPAVLALSYFSYQSVRSPSVILKILAVAAVVLLGYLSLESGFRTHLLLIMLGLILASTKGIKNNWGNVGIVIVLATTLTFAYYEVIMEVLMNSRYRLLLSGSLDESTLERYNEVKDVLYEIDNHWTLIDYVLGSGHGASYTPYFSYITRNVAVNDMVHNIHFGPLLAFFRYGIVGAIAYVFLLGVSIRVYVRASGEIENIVAIAGILYLVNFFVRNIFVDPIAIFVLSAMLVINSYIKRPKANKFRYGLRYYT